MINISATKTAVDTVVLAAYQEQFPGCRTFLADFFDTCCDYAPEVNYLNYVRDLTMYSATNRHIRQNLLALVRGFYDITGTTPAGIHGRLRDVLPSDSGDGRSG